jgi:predicted transcriptional regulator of viral defense system
MAMNVLELAIAAVVKSIESSAKEILSRKDLEEILSVSRKTWKLNKHITIEKVVEQLLQSNLVRESTFKSKDLPTTKKYTLTIPSPYRLALSLRTDSYLCHGTAAFLHGLTPESGNTVFVNREQSEKPFSTSLKQSDLTRAFLRKQRVTRGIYTCDDWKYVLVNGKQTHKLGVEGIVGPAKEELIVTNLERTLIDITVRPAYAGGTQTVLNSYRLAKPRMSPTKILSILKKLRYLYPYHQAIGCYMQRAGYSHTEYEQLKTLGLKFDFYLAHATQPNEYVQEWRLYVPKNFWGEDKNQS